MSINTSISPQSSLERLLEGNSRYMMNNLSSFERINPERKKTLLEGQSPYAAILGCADSRTPPEHIFDGGLGELFVLRNAGNIVDEVVLGSIEYAVAHTGCPLVCVMGHNKCGAVGATVQKYKNPSHYETSNVDDIVRRLMNAVIATKSSDHASDADWINAAAKKNVEYTCENIFQRSSLISKRAADKMVGVVGLWYDLDSGKVDVIVPMN